VRLSYGVSRLQLELNFTREIARHGRDSVYLRLALKIADQPVSEDTVFFTAPRFMNFPRALISTRITLMTQYSAVIRFRSSTFQYRLWFDFGPLAFFANDNCFDLHPGRERIVLVRFKKQIALAQLIRKLKYVTITDTY